MVFGVVLAVGGGFGVVLAVGGGGGQSQWGTADAEIKDPSNDNVFFSVPFLLRSIIT